MLKEDERGPFGQPQFVPGLRTVLVQEARPSRNPTSRQWTCRSERPERSSEGTNPQFASPDTLLFERQGGVWAVRFNPKLLATVGTPVTVLESVRLAGGGQRQAMFAAATNGSLVYVGAANTETSIVWLDERVRPRPPSARAPFSSSRGCLPMEALRSERPRGIANRRVGVRPRTGAAPEVDERRQEPSECVVT